MIRRRIGLLSSQKSDSGTGGGDFSTRRFADLTLPLLGSSDGTPSIDELCRETMLAFGADSCFVVLEELPNQVAHSSWTQDAERGAPWDSDMLTSALRNRLTESHSYVLSDDAKAEPTTRQLANRRGVCGIAAASLHMGRAVSGFVFVEFLGKPPAMDDRHGQFLLSAARVCSSALRCRAERDRRDEAERARSALLDDLANAEERGRARLAKQLEVGPLESMRNLCAQLSSAAGGPEQLHGLADELANLDAMLSAPMATASLTEAIDRVASQFDPPESSRVTIRDLTTHPLDPGNHALLIRLVEAALGEIMSSRDADPIVIVLRSVGGGTLLSIRASSRGLVTHGDLVGTGGTTHSAEMDVVRDRILKVGGTCDAQLQTLGMSSVKAWFPD